MIFEIVAQLGSFLIIIGLLGYIADRGIECEKYKNVYRPHSSKGINDPYNYSMGIFSVILLIALITLLDFLVFPKCLPDILDSLNNSTNGTYLLKQTFTINNVEYKVRNIAFNFFLLSLIPICTFYIGYYLAAPKTKYLVALTPKSLKRFIKIFTRSISVDITLIIETIDKTNKEERKQICVSKIYAEDSDFFYYLDRENKWGAVSKACVVSIRQIEDNKSK